MKQIILIVPLILILNGLLLVSQVNSFGGRYINQPELGKSFELNLSQIYEDKVDVLLWYSIESKFIILKENTLVNGRRVMVPIPNNLKEGTFYKFFIRDESDGLIPINNNFITIGTSNRKLMKYKEDFKFNIFFNIYPNPATNYISVDLSNFTNIVTKLQVINLEGRVILTKPVNSKTSLELNVSGLKAGYYNLTLTDTNGSLFTGKFIKE